MPDLTINYAHAWDTMNKGVDDQGPFYTVSYYFLDWNDSDTVANQLRGYTSRVGSTTVRQSPHQHPLSPNLICMDVQIEGCGQPVLNASGLPAYTNGFLAHCTYRTWMAMPFAANDPSGLNQIDPSTPIPWCTQELDYEVEEMSWEKNKYNWETSDALNGEPSGIPIKVTLGVTTMSLTFHKLPYLPMGPIANYRNKINSTTFLSFSAYKVKFLGARTTRDRNTDGTICQKLQLLFKHRDVDWRMFLRKDIIDWALIKDSNGNYVYSAADLNPLIQL